MKNQKVKTKMEKYLLLRLLKNRISSESLCNIISFKKAFTQKVLIAKAKKQNYLAKFGGENRKVPIFEKIEEYSYDVTDYDGCDEEGD